MAYNAIDVTTFKGDTIHGPLFWFPGGYDGEVDIDFDAKSTEGWIQIGEASTEGVDINQEADKNPKMVWGAKNLGSIYSNFTSTILVRHASTTDPDLLGVVYGEGNVVVSAGVVDLSIRNRTPGVGSLLIQAKTDDGRRVIEYVPLAQPDLNLSYTWGDEDVTVIEVTYDCLQLNDGTTNRRLIERESEEPADPEEAQYTTTSDIEEEGLNF